MPEEKRTLYQIVEEIADHLYDCPEDDRYIPHTQTGCNCKECFIKKTMIDIKEAVLRELLKALKESRTVN